MNLVVILIVLGLAFIALGLKRKKRRRRKKSQRGSWSFSKSKSKPKTRSQSWYEQPAWKRIRDQRRKLNNEQYGLGKAKNGRLLLKCERCGVVGAYHQIDHIKPRQKFPKLAYSLPNTQVLCGPKNKSCNQKKSDKIDGYNWRAVRRWTGPFGPAVAFYLRRKQVREGKR